ncbi:zinc finger protein 526 [Engraulis encrasicolus]|uniref:zinc finger protein 526 n=1 Tax=Engraulis encrasicolus TaxID=184585 RepID=UPI002FD6F4C7
MNGALYISFFQGQLESALEQVVQLAVQEITKTVGATLNSMLMETTAKDQENQRLRLKLQSTDSECNVKRHGKPATFKGGRETTMASEETKPEQHTPSPSRERSMQADALRIEQKGRAVGQLKAVMEQVLEFAVTELTKIVEDSFDDLVLEMTKVEHENDSLSNRLLRTGKKCRNDSDSGSKSDSAVEEKRGGVTTGKRESDNDNDSDSPGSSEGTRQEVPRVSERAAKITRAKQQVANDATNDTDKQKVLAVAQDWVPILDKVFGQKWCSDAWHIKEVASVVKAEGNADIALSPLGPGQASGIDALIRETLQPTLPPTGPREPNTGQSQWLQPEDLEVLSPPPEHQTVPVVSSPTGGVPDLTSPSMLHRLLTLPSQLLEGDEESSEGLPVLSEAPGSTTEAFETAISPGPTATPPTLTAEEEVVAEEEEEMEEEEEDEGDKSSDTDHCFSPRGPPRGPARKSHGCKQCGKRFARAHLLKAHQQTHELGSALRCSECGKRFTHTSRLQAHLRTHREHHTRGRRDPQH